MKDPVKLMRNMISPKGGRRAWYSITAGTKETEVRIYDEIGWWGTTAKGLVQQITAIKTPVIRLRIHSPGGDVFEAAAIFNALKRHEARVEVHIDGLAASAASYIALAGDVVRMAKNAFFMIHNPWSFAVGDAEELRKAADITDKIGESMAETYAENSAKTLDEIKALMADETWFNAQEALDAGFIDEIEGENDIEAKFDMSVFSHAPEQLQPRAGRDADPEPPSERDVERILRDAGFSRRQAAAIVAEGYQAADQRDADIDAKADAGTVEGDEAGEVETPAAPAAPAAPPAYLGAAELLELLAAN